jgi:tetratricopeptide (TPR) repeat protein
MSWTRAQAVAYLGPVSGLQRLANADELAAELGDDPVGLRLARGFLEQRRVGVGAYLREIRRRRVAGVALSGAVALARTELSWPARGLSRLLSHLAAEPLRLEWVSAAIVDRGALSKRLAWSLGLTAEAVAELQQYGLVAVSQDGEWVRMHAAVQDAVRAISMRRNRAREAMMFVLGALGEPDEPASWPMYEHLAEHAQRFAEHAREIQRMRTIGGVILSRLGEYAAARGRRERATLLFKAALEQTRDARMRADLHFRMGDVLGESDPEAALRYLEQSVDLAARAYGTGHPAVTRNRHSLANALERLDNLPGARQQLERALAEGEAHLGPGHLDLAVGRSSLGNLLRREGDLVGSRAVLEETLGVLVTAVGDDDDRVTACRTALADTYVELGELEAARDQLERAVASGKRLVGANHPHVRSGCDRLKDVLRALGQETADNEPAPTLAEPVPEYLLEAYGFALDRTSWRWRLTGRDGIVRAEHAVALDLTAAEYQALTDLDGWLRWRPAPDRRRSDEARLIRALGEWIGCAVLGPVATALADLAAAEATTVRVRVPPEASWLPEYPLELAIPPGGAEPLALLPVQLVFEVADAAPVPKKPVEERLRMLAVFSTPSGGTALDLRRERRALERLAAAHPDAVELHVVQYGSSPERLATLLANPRGWDIVHLTGHGGPGELVLETAAGTPRPVPSSELTALLRPARPRLKLLVTSWCSSAADTALSVLDLDPPDDLLPDTADTPVSTALAPRLAATLACTVLAMRHPIGDSFSTNLAEQLYTRLFAPTSVSWEALVAQAVTHSLRTTTLLRPLWLASPVLFTIPTPSAAPREPSSDYSPAASETQAEAIPNPPDADQSDGPLGSPAAAPEAGEVFVGRVEVLARMGASGAGVLFTGMPGVGKTACALEMAYTRGGEYARVVWCRADEVEGVVVGERELIVVDGLDSEWDERQCAVVAKLARRVMKKAGRLVLTSRERPMAEVPGVMIEALQPLGTTEAMLMVAAHGRVTGAQARRLLAAAGGVPGLLDGATARAEIIAWAERRIEGMTREQQIFLAFLCALETADRDGGPAIEMVWDPVRRELTGEDMDASAAPLVAELAAHGLATAVAAPTGVGMPAWGAPMCPAVMEAGQRLLDDETERIVVLVASDYWTFALNDYAKIERKGLSHAVVYAARRLLPYRMRLGDWRGVKQVLGVIWQRESAPELAATVGAALRRAAPRSDVEESALVALLAELEARSGQPETEAELAAAVERAAADGDHRLAAEVGIRLVNLLLLVGRAEQALPLVGRLLQFGRSAGLNRTDLLELRVQRPQLLVATGRFAEGLDEARRLLRQASRGHEAWHVREVLHNIALRAAVKLERYSEALAYSDAIAASMSARGASDLELAQALLNTAIVHRESGRPDLARTMLLRAQEVFEAAREVESLIAARVSLAELEAREDRPEEAVLLSRDVLRLRYTGLPEGDPAAVRDAHVNLSVHLTRVGGRIDAEALIHLVAATLIDDLAGSWRYAETVFRLQGLAATRYWEDEGFPASFAELETQLAATPGVRFRAYVATLPGGEPAAEQALEQLRPVVRYATESLFLQLTEWSGYKVGYLNPDGADPEPAAPPRKLSRFVRRGLFRRRR